LALQPYRYKACLPAAKYAITPLCFCKFEAAALPASTFTTTPYRGLQSVNHLAYEVDDVEALCKRMKAAGYRGSTPPNAHPHRKRRYFYDAEGNDWECVEYLSQDPTERNDYKVPDR
jgi:catechol 2,3-dioxygenase-like lactoylglutathione lyase family enzyme